MSSLPAMPPGVKKVFLAYLDTHVGIQLTQKLLASECEVCGLLNDPNNGSAVSSKVKKVLRRGECDPIRKAILECDLIVYEMANNVDDSISALRLLTSNHFESEKRFVLLSSTMTWFETPPLADPASTAEDEDVEVEAVTEDQYNRRVPHIKYLAWRDVEKLCCTSNSERLKTFVVFSGLVYGVGENVLHPLFKQAWSLAPEGIPVYGTGKQLIPMIHVTDLCNVIQKTLTLTELPENRYIFAVDEGNCSWNDIVKALNTSLGTGKTFRVPRHEFGLHENVENFVINLKVESQQIASILTEETDWVCKSGFVENMEMICAQYRKERHIEPLRILIAGPPSSGKSFVSREIATGMNVPHFTIGDIIQEYKYQEVEFHEELARLKEERYRKKLLEKQDEKRSAIMEEKKAALEAANADKEKAGDSDNDDIDEEEEMDVTMTPEEEKELREAAEDDEGDERVAQINEKMDEIKRVLGMKLKPLGEQVQEPPNPKDKKKPPPKGKGKEVQEVKEEPKADVRLSDRALGFMVKWKLTRTQCRNQGFVLDGFPNTVRQARLAFEDYPIEIPEDPEAEADMPLEKEEKPCADTIFPDMVIHCKAGDTFLLERLQKTQFEHPHNAPEEFQRRLEFYKQHFDVAVGVLQYLESARSTAGKSMTVQTFDVEQCPLVPPPPPKSTFAARTVHPVVKEMLKYIGSAHNFGPTPQDAFKEAERVRSLQQEQRLEYEAQERSRKEKEATDVAQAHQSKSEENIRLANMKENERLMLEQRKGPLKNYLMANVIPVLTKGLIETCNQRPDDPVDFLAEWLFKHNPEDHPEMYS